jgi:hypothetical protein
MTIHVAPSIITDRSPGRPAKAARTAAEARARMRRDVVVCWSPPAGSYAMQLNTDSCSAEHDWPSHSTFLKNGRPKPATEIMGFGSFANSLFHFDGDNVSTAWQGSVIRVASIFSFSLQPSWPVASLLQLSVRLMI